MTKDEALKDLLEIVENAIKIGDWKVDGRCDPDLAINRAKEALEQQEQLSDDEIWEIVNETHHGLSPFEDTFRFARAIEAKIRGE